MNGDVLAAAYPWWNEDDAIHADDGGFMAYMEEVVASARRKHDAGPDTRPPLR